MRRRIVSLLLALCMGFTLLPGRAAAADTVEYPVEGGNLFFDKLTGTITDADSKYITSAVIPESIEGVPVTALRSYTFQGNTSLKSVTINAGITELGDYSFKGCSALESVKLPETVTSIGAQTFIDCTSLKDINLPNAITEIGGQAFRGCASLGSVTLPTGMTSTGTGFYFCTGLEEITIPSSVTTITQNAFYGCTALKTVRLPDTLTTIEARAFTDCSSLAEISIPDSVTSIGGVAFSGCSSLESFRFPKTITIIESKALASCSSLKEVKVPKTVRNIERQAFLDCDAITDFYVGASKAEWKEYVQIAREGNGRIVDTIITFHYNGYDSTPVGPDTPIPIDQIKVEVNSPVELLLSPDGKSYDNNPFSVSVKVTNQSEASLTVRVKPDFSESRNMLLSAEPENAVCTVAAGTSETLACRIRAFLQAGQVQVPYTIILEDKAGTTEIYRETLSITLPKADVDVCTIKFDLNGGRGTTPDVQVLPVGSTIEYPKQTPVKEGYIFDGWYSYYGDSFWFQKLSASTTASRDMTFQASWSKRTNVFKLGVDNLSFANSSKYFFNQDDAELWYLDGDAKDILLNTVCKDFRTDEEGKTESARIQEEMAQEWGGSCFGMCAVPVLVMQGKLSPAYFQPGAIHTYDLQAPKESADIRNLINYYYLIQNTDYFVDHVPNKLDDVIAITPWDREKAHLESLVRLLEKDEGPVILRIRLEKKKTDSSAFREYGGHIIIAYGCEKTVTGDYYDINIWDPNLPNGCRKLFIKSDFSQKTIDHYDGNIYDTAGAFVEERRSQITYFADFNQTDYYDFVNLQDELMAREKNSAASKAGIRSRAVDSTPDSNYVLYTNYPEFTISCSDGTSARVENGTKISGDIEISNGEYLNEPDYNAKIRFSLARLPEGGRYTIIPETVTSIQTGDPIGEYSTSLYSPGAKDGFFAKTAANARGEIIFEEGGTIKTSFDTAVEQRVVVTRNDYTTPWYMVSATGTTTGVTAAPSADEVSFSTKDSSPVAVSAANDFNQVTFEKVSTDNAEGIRIAQSDADAGMAVILDGNDVIQDSKSLGYSAVFYSLCGTRIDAQSDIPGGGKVVRPADPVRVGYKFDGWYLDLDYVDPWSFDTPVTEDIRLYAKWTPVSLSPDSYTVKSWTVSGGTTRVEFTDPMVLWQEDISLLAAEYAPSGKLLRVVEGILTGDLEHGNGAAAFPAALSENSAVFFLGAGKVPLGPKVLLTNEKRQ